MSIDVAGCTPSVALRDEDGSADVPMPGGSVHLSAADRSAHYRLWSMPTPDQFAHPLLGPVAVLINHWLGRLPLHAGAVAVDGGAWALLGDREHGKSTSLAILAGLGATVVTDDILVLDRGRAYSGVRCIDLRADAAGRFEGRDVVDLSGQRRRRRVPLPPCASSYPLRGLLQLEWTDGPDELVPVPPSAVIPALVEHLALQRSPPDPLQLLDLAAVPLLRWRRPKDLTGAPASAARLLDELRRR